MNGNGELAVRGFCHIFRELLGVLGVEAGIPVGRGHGPLGGLSRGGGGKAARRGKKQGGRNASTHR